jgi:hypothetical protein
MLYKVRGFLGNLLTQKWLMTMIDWNDHYSHHILWCKIIFRRVIDSSIQISTPSHVLEQKAKNPWISSHKE